MVGERDRRGAAERKDPGNLLDHHWCVSPETLCWNKSLQPFLNLKNLVRNDQNLLEDPGSWLLALPPLHNGPAVN